MTHPLALTGERTLPGIAEEGYWFARHEAAYHWAVRHLGPAMNGARVVEAGAGEGYGADALARAGARVVAALEYDVATCAHASTAYPDVRVVRANLAALPLRSGSVDVVATLQVVEHLWDLPGFLTACRNALVPGGVLVVTTPNRLTFSPGLGRGERPTNPFHVEEFDAAQLRDLVQDSGFVDVSVAVLRHGPRLAAWESTHGSLVAAQVQAVLSGTWPPALLDLVASVTADDFEVGPLDADDGLDLLLTARAAA